MYKEAEIACEKRIEFDARANVRMRRGELPASGRARYLDPACILGATVRSISHEPQNSQGLGVRSRPMDVNLRSNRLGQSRLCADTDTGWERTRVVGTDSERERWLLASPSSMKAYTITFSFGSVLS